MKTYTYRALCPEPQNYSSSGLKEMATLVQLDAVELGQRAFVQQSHHYDMLMVRLQRHVDQSIISRASRLKAILSPTTGLDHIDMEAARARDIAVFSLSEETDFLQNIHASAEHTFALILSLIRKIPSAFEAVKQFRWAQLPYQGHELNGLTLGIIGLGRNGAKVGRFGNSFEMRVLAYDPYINTFPQDIHACSTLRALLKESQVLSIHVPLNKDTESMVGASELELLPQGAYLINTSRGDVLDESALLEYLKQGHLAGAALDVLTNEHLITTKGHPLVDYAKTHPNLLITPHIGGAAKEAIEKTDMFVIQRFSSWIEHQRCKGSS